LALDRGIAQRHPVKVCRDEVVFERPELAATDPHLLLARWHPAMLVHATWSEPGAWPGSDRFEPRSEVQRGLHRCGVHTLRSAWLLPPGPRRKARPHWGWGLRS